MPFVIGAPRSGTTLLRFMLDSHPELAIPPETGFLALAPKLRGRGDRLRERFFRTVTTYPAEAPAWPDFEIDAGAYRRALDETSPFTAREGFRTFYRLYAARFGKRRWGDKTPLYCLAMDAVRGVLPEARFVHIIRDGRDVALSLRPLWFSPAHDIAAQAAYWGRCVRTARRAGLERDDYLEVRYEDLVLRTRETLERVCAHVGLSFHPDMLEYHRRTPQRLHEHKGRWRADGTPVVTQRDRLRQQERTTRPPDPARVGAWRRAMGAAEQELFREVAGDLLSELGYE